VVFSNGYAPQRDAYHLAEKMLNVGLPSSSVVGNVENIQKDAEYKSIAINNVGPSIPQFGEDGSYLGRMPAPRDETPVKMPPPRAGFIVVMDVVSGKAGYWPAQNPIRRGLVKIGGE
jgi:hypothetical protein